VIQLEGVTLAPGGEPLLFEASWHLRPGQRVGLVGRNGTGKTTLLRAIVGERPPDEGQVRGRSSVRLGWLPQQAVAGSERTVWDEASLGLAHLRALEARLRAAEQAVADREPDAIERLDRATEAFRIAGGYQMDERIGEVLHGLGFGPDAWHRPCATFSGGWQMRIALAKVLLSEPDVLVLDEPTNHLDLHARAWLARHLARTPATVLLVSHDRHLLDAVCTEILEIRSRSLHVYAGNFTAFLAQRDERIAQQRQAFASQQEEIARLERFVERFKAKATKAAQARSRQNRLDRMERLDAPDHERLPRFRLPPAPPAEAELLALDRATLGWTADVPIVHEATLTLERGMRVVVLGPNGAGKSTLLHALAGRLRPLSGRRRHGQRARIGVFDQDQAAALPTEATALEHVMATAPRAGETRARSILGALGLPGEDALRPIGQLSGGEKARVALAALSATEHNVLLLDEPTNHLDATTAEVLVRALADFDGAIVLVTHDRFVAETLATHVARVAEGGLFVREGLLPEDLEPLAARREGARAASASPGPTDHEQRKQERRELERGRKRLSALEDEIGSLDAEIAAVDAKLFDEAGDFARARALDEERASLVARHEAAMAAWEELALRLEALAERLDASA
jgi:ATP-binding cassette subfamily F protein 3